MFTEDAPPCLIQMVCASAVDINFMNCCVPLLSFIAKIISAPPVTAPAYVGLMVGKVKKLKSVPACKLGN